MDDYKVKPHVVKVDDKPDNKNDSNNENKNCEKEIDISFIIDTTYSMSRIYAYVYPRLCEEIDELQKISNKIDFYMTCFDGEKVYSFPESFDAETLKSYLRLLNFYGGSVTGYESVLNEALQAETKRLSQETDACIRGIVLVTDSMPCENAAARYDGDGSLIDFIEVFSAQPWNAKSFIQINNRMRFYSTEDMMAGRYKGSLYNRLKEILNQPDW